MQNINYSNNDKLAMINQGNKRTLTLDLDYTDINESYVGKIVFHYPSQLEKLKIGTLRAQLLGGILPMDIQTDNLALIFSTFDVVVDHKPEWFDYYNNPEIETEVLVDLYKKYDEWLLSFRKRGKQQDDSGDSANTRS